MPQMQFHTLTQRSDVNANAKPGMTPGPNPALASVSVPALDVVCVCLYGNATHTMPNVPLTLSLRCVGKLLSLLSTGKSNGYVHTQSWYCMRPKMLWNIAIS